MGGGWRAMHCPNKSCPASRKKLFRSERALRIHCSSMFANSGCKDGSCSAALEKLDFCQLIPQITKPPDERRSTHQKRTVSDSLTTVPAQCVEYGYREWANNEFGDKAMEELQSVFAIMETEEEERRRILELQESEEGDEGDDDQVFVMGDGGEDLGAALRFRRDGMVEVGFWKDEISNVPEKLRFETPVNFDSGYLSRRRQTSRREYDSKGHAKPRNIGYSEDQPVMIDKEMMSTVELMRILQGHDVGLFNKIRQWRFKSDYIYRAPTPSHTGYYKGPKQKVLDKIAESYGYHNLHAKVVPVQLPRTAATADIVIFPFGDMLLSLLTDPELMQPENLLLDFGDPFKQPKYGGDCGFLDDINTGKLYVENHEWNCPGENDIPCYLILFIDKSHVDQKGKITLEPVMATLSIFTKEARVKAGFWRPIGYLPNMEHVAPRCKPDDKLHDYHFALRMILDEYIQYQKLGGIEWVFRDCEGGRDIHCRLQIQLAFIIGDTEGHDKLAGRRVDRATGGSPQCRYCDVKLEDCADPFARVELTMAADVRLWREQARLAEKNNDKDALEEADQKLRELGYRNVMNAFDDVEFVDNVRGIHGATPAEVLHAMNLGPQERCLDSCFRMKRKKKKREKKGGGDNDRRKKLSPPEGGAATKKRKFQMKDGNEEEEEARMDRQREESKQGVFSKSMCTWVDEMAKKLHLQLRWQSARDMPRLSFPHGITNLAKMTGSERTGVLLLLLLILCIENVEYEMRRGKQRDPTAVPESYTKFDKGYLAHVLNPKRNREMIKGIFLLLCIEGFLKLRRIPIAHLDKVNEFMKSAMATVFEAFPRDVGMGHMTAKAHFVLHYIMDLIRFSSGLNFNSGPGEKNHKENIKRPGRNTQRRADTFAVQCAKHYVNMLTVSRAWKDHPAWACGERETGGSTEEKGEVLYGGAYMTIRKTSVFYGIGSQGKPTKRRNLRRIDEKSPPHWKDSELAYADLLSIVRRMVMPKMGGNSTVQSEIQVHTRTRVNGTWYHANPAHGRRKLAKQNWGQCRLQQEGNGGAYVIYPCQLLCIVHLKNDLATAVRMDCGTSMKKKGYYFLVHRGKSTFANETPAEGEAGGEFWPNWEFGSLAEPNQQIVHCMQKKTVRGEIGSEEDGEEDEGGDREKALERYAILAVACGDLVGPLVGIWDYRDRKDDVKKLYYFLMGQEKWGDLFYDMAMEESGTELFGRSGNGACSMLAKVVVEISDEGSTDSSEAGGGNASDANRSDCDSEDDDSDGHILEEEEEDGDYDQDGDLVKGNESDTEW